MIRIALLYAAGLAAVIALADANRLPEFAERIHDYPFGDKALHFVLYGTLALLANLALASTGRWPLARTVATGSAVVLIAATAEEYSNRFVAVRDCSLGDLAANYLGVLVIGILPLLVWALALKRPLMGKPAPTRVM